MPFFHGIEMLGMLSMRRPSSSDRDETRKEVNEDSAEKVVEKFVSCVRSTSMEHPFIKCHFCGTKYTRAFEPVHHSCGIVSCFSCAQNPPRNHNIDEMVKYSVQRFNYHLQNYRSHNLSIASEKEKLLEELEEQLANQYAKDLERIQGLGESTSRPELNAMGMVFNQLAGLIRMQADYVAHCTPPLLQEFSGSAEISAATTDLLKSLHDCSIQMRTARESYRKITEMYCRQSPMISRSELCSSRLPSSIACCCVQSIGPTPEVEDTERFPVPSTTALCSHEEGPFWDFEIPTPDEPVVTSVVETQVPTGDDELNTPSTSGCSDEPTSESGAPVPVEPVDTPLDNKANSPKLSKTPNDVKKKKQVLRIHNRVVNRLVASFAKFHIFDDPVNVSNRISFVGVAQVPNTDMKASVSNKMSLETIAEDPIKEDLNDSPNRRLVDNVGEVSLGEDDEQKNVPPSLQTDNTHTQTPVDFVVDVDVPENSALDEAAEKKSFSKVRMMTPEERANILKNARQHDDKKPRSQHQMRSNCCGSEFSEK